MAAHEDEARINRQIVARAQKVVVVTDSSCIANLPLILQISENCVTYHQSLKPIALATEQDKYCDTSQSHFY